MGGIVLEIRHEAGGRLVKICMVQEEPAVQNGSADCSKVFSIKFFGILP